MSRESKNLHQARAYARQFKSEADASLLIETIRKEIPNSRLLNYKFMHGVVRMSLEGEIKTGNDIADINRALEFIASDAHKDEYDKNFNGDKLSVLTTRFAEVVHDAVRGDMEKIESLNLGEYNKEYTIVPVPDYETASKYSEFTSWCITHHSNMYDSYTNDGLGTFYFCLKDGYDKLPNTHVGDSPLDEYGLSMIAVSVRADGSMNTCTCRWNHDNGGGDAIMTTEELSKLLGVNFYKAFHAPKLPEEIKGCKVLLDDGRVVTVGEFDSITESIISVLIYMNKLNIVCIVLFNFFNYTSCTSLIGAINGKYFYF